MCRRLLNQIAPGLRQARSALADASIAASDTPPGGSQPLDADAMQDALSPSPKQRGSEETSDSPPPKRARASLSGGETADSATPLDLS